MYFFEAKADEQNRILMEALPCAEVFFDIYDKMKTQKIDSPEHKAASEARLALMTAEALLANDRDNKKKRDEAVKARFKAMEALEAVDRLAERSGRAAIKDVLFGGNVTQYADNAYSIVALFRNQAVKEMMAEKGIIEIFTDMFMIFESEQVVNFLEAVRKFQSIKL